jgi:hypothetical protein
MLCVSPWPEGERRLLARVGRERGEGERGLGREGFH